MSNTDLQKRIYTVVEVISGVAVAGYAFRRLKNARKCANGLRAQHDPMEDDVQIFETKIDTFDPQSPQLIS